MTPLETLAAEPVPIKADASGVLRVGGTRVRLETVLAAFANGCSPEEILLKYPSLRLTDIYATITYYLWHRSMVDAYLDQRRNVAAQSAHDVESRFPNAGLRERLLARRASRD